MEMTKIEVPGIKSVWHLFLLHFVSTLRTLRLIVLGTLRIYDGDGKDDA